MKGKFLSSLFLLMLFNFLVKPFWLLGIDRSIQNVVGAESYGMYYALFNLSFLLDILLDLGITNYNNRSIAQNHALVGKNLIGIAYLKIGLAVLYLGMSLGFGAILGYHNPMLYLLFVLGINKVLLSGILFLRSNVSGLQLFKTDAVLSVLDRSFLIIICAALLWGGFVESEFQIVWLVYAQTVAYFLSLLISIVVVLGKSTGLKWQLNIGDIKAILKQSLPYALVILFMSIYYRVDAVMLERMLDNGDFEAGIYAQGYRILDALNMVAYLFVGILFPLFSKQIANKEKYQTILNLSNRLLLSFAMVVAVSCFFYGDQITNLLYTETSTSSGDVFSLLVLCFIPISFVNIHGTLLTANGNLRDFNIIAFSGIIINVGLNLWLIPQYAAFGSALATLLTNSFIAILIFIALHRRMNLESDPLLALKLIGLGALMMLAQLFLYPRTGLSWTSLWFISLALGGLGAFVLRIIGMNSIKAFLKLKK